MKNKSPLSFPLLICAVITTVALYRQFDFKTGQFHKPALSLVYGATLGVLVYLSVKNRNRKPRS